MNKFIPDLSNQKDGKLLQTGKLCGSRMSINNMEQDENLQEELH